MTEPRWLDDAEAAAWVGFNRMHQKLFAVLDRKLAAESGLSGADYTVLVVLSAAPESTMRARDLGASVHWEKSRLSHQTTRMERRGLVRRRSCPTDARGSFVALTEEGRAAIEAAAPGHVEAVRAAFVDLLTPEQLATLATISEVVLDGLAAETCEDGLADERR